MPTNSEYLSLMKVEGLPPFTGRLSFEGRQRASQLEARLEGERLAYALVEREEQLAVLMEKLRERS